MGLSDDQVKAEMSKMVRFIQQEAREKANEITAKAQEEFSIEKGTLVQQEKLKIITAYERKMKQVEVQRKILYSNRLNQSRLKILQARDQVVESIFQEARSRLTQIVSSPGYKTLLSKLVLQALFLCMEAKVTIVCKKQDVAAVQAVIPDAINQYKQALGKNTECSISMTEFLPEDCAGGIVASAMDGKIRLTNTLDARLELLGQEMLPEIRNMLFGQNKNRAFYS